MTRRRGFLWLIAGVALALLAGRWMAAVYGEWAFHHALGSDSLWRSAIVTRGALRLTIFVSAFAFVFANLYAVRQSIISLVLPRQFANLEISEAVPPRRLTGFALGGALLIAVIFAALDHDWTVAALAFNGVPFGEIDPYFERDISFYVSWLPFERSLNALVSMLVLLTSGLVIALYVSTPSVRWDERGLYVSAWVRRHLGILAGLVMGLVAWDWRFDRFALLSEGNGGTSLLGELASFGRYDHRVLIPYLVVLSFVAVPVAVVFVWSMWRGYIRVALSLLTLIILAGPVARLVLPVVALASLGGTAANARERPYVNTRTLYTRRAFGVDQIVRTPSRSSVRLAPAQMARWVSAWDPAALTRHIELERRGTDVVALTWQTGAGGLDAILLRDAPVDAAPGTAWPADRLVAHAVDSDGSPVAASGSALTGFGGVLVMPNASRYVLVADTTGRIAAPRFESTLERVALAWDQQNPRLLASDPPSPRPRLLTHRDVRERVGRVAPFFRAGPTITPVVRGDSLYWVIELFAVAREYPLSERFTFDGARAHYVHHAATAVVQAQSGRVMLLPSTRADSLTASWIRMFPALFTARADAPRWLAGALPPPTDWVMVQGAMLARTGFPGDTLQERALARVDDADADADLAGGPATLFQADSAGALAWGLPVVGRQDARSGLLTAVGGLFPRSEFQRPAAALDWTDALEKLQAAADEAGFGRALPHSRRGRVQAIPSSTGPAFTQSFYEWPPDGPPRLAGVVVLMDGRTMVGRSLATALGQRDQPTGSALPAEVFRTRVSALYDAMSAASRVGDWHAYGDAWFALGRLLGRP